MEVVELDRKGRILVPCSMRKQFGTHRFRVKIVEGRIELIPLRGVKALKDKYRNRLKTPWAKLEEKAEKSVKRHRC